MSREDNVITTASKVRALVHLQSNAMAKPMSEVLLPAVRFQNRSSSLVGSSCIRTVFSSAQGGGLGISNGIPNLELSFGEDSRRKSECLGEVGWELLRKL